MIVDTEWLVEAFRQEMFFQSRRGSSKEQFIIQWKLHILFTNEQRSSLTDLGKDGQARASVRQT